jgi:micrococcal nuclease
MKILILLTFLTISVTAKQYSSIIINDVISVYDGDTFRVNIKGYPPVIGENIAIRINGVDTPEIRGKCERENQLAIKARNFTRLKLSKGNVIELRNVKRGKYFRIAADVYIDNVNLGQILINANLAKKYSKNQKKGSWCG